MLRSNEVLLDVLGCLSRYELDTASLVCRQYSQLVASKMSTVCLRLLTNAVFYSSPCPSDDVKKAKSTDSDSSTVYRVEYGCKKLSSHYTRTLHHTDEFACQSQAAEHLIGVLRSSYVGNLSITFELFDHASSEAFTALFKSLRAAIVDLTFPQDAADILPCLQALGVEQHLRLTSPATQTLAHLFAAIAPLKLSHVVMYFTYTEQREAYDVMDDAIVAYLFQQDDGSHLRTNATVSSAFLGKLLKRFHETPTSALCSINAQIECPKQAIPADFPGKRRDFGGEVAYVWTKDIPGRRSVLNIHYRIFSANAYSVQLNGY